MHDKAVTIVKVLCGTPEYDQVLQLRSQSYGIPLSAAGDAIDQYSTIWLALAVQQPVGTIRVTYARNGFLDCEQFFPEELLVNFRPSLSSASRFCVPKHGPRDLKIAHALVNHAREVACNEGIRIDVVDVNQRAVAYYQRMGYWLVPDSDFVHPLLHTPSVVMLLSADPNISSFLRAVFSSIPDPLPLHIVQQTISGKERFNKSCDTAMPAKVQLSPGSVLSYSAGSYTADPERFRFVAPKPAKFGAILARFPLLAEIACGQAPLIINAYPATPGTFDFGILVDSYGRSTTVSRALHQAVDRGHPAIVIGMPLMIANLLTHHLSCDWRLPAKILLILGGYYCPSTLESYLVNCAEKMGGTLRIVHAYGVAEIDAALMAAMERTIEGELIYYPIDADWQPSLNGAMLAFIPANSIAEDQKIVTEERAMSHPPDGFVIANPESRLAVQIRQLLQTWTISDWERRTGFIGCANGRLLFQTRDRVKTSIPEEVDFHSFCRQFGMSWFEKPDWSGCKH